MRDLTIIMDHTRGRPANLLEAIAARGVTVQAGCLFSRIDERVAHVAVDDGEVAAVRAAATETGCVLADERECAFVPPGFEGGVAAMARRIADAGGTVTVAYYAENGGVVMSTTDPALATKLFGES